MIWALGVSTVGHDRFLLCSHYLHNARSQTYVLEGYTLALHKFHFRDKDSPASCGECSRSVPETQTYVLTCAFVAQ